MYMPTANYRLSHSCIPMPSSPRTPTRRRKSSTTSINLSLASSGPQSNGYHSKRGSISRRSSQYSVVSPITLRPTSSYDRGEYGLPNGFDSGEEPETSNGLGNLADELAEAFDEGEEEEEEVGEVGEVGEEIPQNGYDDSEAEVEGHHPLENDETEPQIPQPSKERSLSPPKKSTRFKHHQRQNSQYDGSDYGDESDLECVDGISPAFEARMAAIEAMARRGTECNGSDHDDVVYRLVERLKDLGSQSHIETSASRLITIHTDLTLHISNQTQKISTLTYPFVSPLSAPPDPEFIDEILPLLTSLTANIPTPTSQPLSSLHSLHASTTEVTTMLTYLSDNLHMMRQTTSLASRRLRSATEMVVEMRREAEAREEAVRWLEKRDWERRLAERECAKVCGDVIGGFEETCNRWREKLLGGLEVGAA